MKIGIYIETHWKYFNEIEYDNFFKKIDLFYQNMNKKFKNLFSNLKLMNNILYILNKINI